MLLCLSGSQNSFYMTVRIQWPRRTGLLRELSKTSLSYFYLNYFELNTALQNILKNLRVKYVLVVFFFYFGRKVILRLHNKLLRKHAEGVLKKNYDWH